MMVSLTDKPIQQFQASGAGVARIACRQAPEAQAMAGDAPNANRDKSDSTMSLDGGWMRFKKLSDEQRKGWHIAGTVYGVRVLLDGHQAGALTAGPAQTLCKPFVRPRWSTREDD